jgi:glucose-6-phosphate 1-dehydrogenase
VSGPTHLVIFGASGDLTRRKLVPALYHLDLKGRLPDDLHIVGFSRRPWSDEAFRERMRAALEEFAPDRFTDDAFARFGPRLHWVEGDLSSSADYEGLEAWLRAHEGGQGQRLYYLSVAPEHYGTAATLLGEHGMTREEQGWRRIIVEKPFGVDLPSAQGLNETLHAVFDEHQVFRIDHYLGKETSLNLLFFRFANTVFEPLWNRNYIDHVQITVAETVGVGHRAGYYDSAGVMRDMFQNHLLQLLTLVAMEPPASFEADAIRNEKLKVLKAIRPIDGARLATDTVRGQYVGYRDADGVPEGSMTATYAALKLQLDNWRWRGVPFYLRSGKALSAKTSELLVVFKEPPHMMFPLPPGAQIRSNYLAVCVQPDEGIHLRFEVKVPDTDAGMRSADMEFHYRSTFGAQALPDAYERLLLDALEGDASLFLRSDELEQSWRLIDPILAGWEGPTAPRLDFYERGTWGPREADKLMILDGRAWTLGCMH